MMISQALTQNFGKPMTITTDSKIIDPPNDQAIKPTDLEKHAEKTIHDALNFNYSQAVPTSPKQFNPHADPRTIPSNNMK